MKLESSRQLPVDVATAWDALNDLGVLKRCIPGCDSLERKPDGSLLAVVTARIGPVGAKFTGTVEILDVVAREGYRLQFSGQGAAAGFAKGQAKVRLHESQPGATELLYSAEASVGGKLAQIGSRLVEASARKLAEDFFSRLETEFKETGKVVANGAFPVSDDLPRPNDVSASSSPTRVQGLNILGAKSALVAVAVVAIASVFWFASR